uniref:Uncharacterized protein n=1 Tax=Graphocephala atropunctata TaxID=36148 RepID=A0A1B6LT80_9HEMI
MDLNITTSESLGEEVLDCNLYLPSKYKKQLQREKEKEAEGGAWLSSKAWKKLMKLKQLQCSEAKGASSKGSDSEDKAKSLSKRSHPDEQTPEADPSLMAKRPRRWDHQ